jgi:hypothetical protein
MAFTVTRTPTVFGNKRAILMNIQADGAEANVESGLSVIEAMVLGQFNSMATGGANVRKNLNSSGTAANGTIGISGLSSGADFDVVVFGR